MSDDSAFVKILQGSALVLIGTVIDMGFSFSTRIFAARWLNPGEYGELVLGVTFLNLLSLVANIGLQDGIARNIPNEDNSSKVFSSGLLIAFVLSSILSVISFAISGYVVTQVFGANYLPIIRVFALAVPFQVILWIVVSGFRGLGITRFPVLFQNVLLRVSIFGLIVIAVIHGYGSIGAAIGWAGGTAIAAMLGLVTLWRVTPLTASPKRLVSYVQDYSPELIKFSLPLMLANSAWRLIQEADNIFIGSYLTSSLLGKYDAGFTIARVILIALWSFSFLFLPLFTKFHKNEQYDDMRLFYSQTTKWITVLIFPVFMLIIRFPREILSIVYGPEYAQAGLVLMIVATAFFTHVCFGMNRTALTSIGETRLVFIFTSVALVTNVLLNFALVPQFGVVGAAIASFGSYVAMNLALNYRLWTKFKIVPISKSTIKSVTVSLLSFVVISYMAISTVENEIVLLAIIGGVHYLVHIIIFIYIGANDRDRELLKLAENRIPINLSSVFK